MGAAGGGQSRFIFFFDRICRIFRINKMQRWRIRCTNVAIKKQTSPSELAAVSFLTANPGKP